MYTLCAKASCLCILVFKLVNAPKINTKSGRVKRVFKLNLFLFGLLLQLAADPVVICSRLQKPLYISLFLAEQIFSHKKKRKEISFQLPKPKKKQ